jgi:hypothetical protein
MGEYGKRGTEYVLGGESIYVDQEFLVATLMATIIVLKEISGNEDTDVVIEKLAEQIYDQILNNKSGNTEDRTSESSE